MEATAKVRYLKMTDRKVNAVLKLIRGMNVETAFQTLRFTRRSAATAVEKCLRSAVANAGQKESFEVEKATVKTCTATQGPVQRNTKRWIPRAQGRATPIKKMSCHLTITVSDGAANKA